MTTLNRYLVSAIFVLFFCLMVKLIAYSDYRTVQQCLLTGKTPEFCDALVAER